MSDATSGDEDTVTAAECVERRRPGSVLVQHPHDPQVWLGSPESHYSVSGAVTAAVFSHDGVTVDTERVSHARGESSVLDRGTIGDDADLDRVLIDGATALSTLRARRHTVVLCTDLARAQRIAALYATRRLAVRAEQAAADVRAAMTRAYRQRVLIDAVALLRARQA